MDEQDSFEDLAYLENSNSDNWIARNWLFVALAAGSMVWVATAYFIVFISPACDGLVKPRNIIDIAGTFGSTLTCRSANEIGDFLAGSFSPLAFLWLFAAVVLQRNELSAQRKELALARAVSVAQTKEARRNVGVLRAQMKLFEKQTEREELEASDRALQTMVDVFMRELNSYAKNGKSGIHIDINLAEGGEKTIRFLDSSNLVGDELVTYHRDYILSAIRDFDNMAPLRSSCNFNGGGWIFEHLRKYSDLVQVHFPQASVAKRTHLEQVGLLSLFFRLKQVEHLFGKLGDKWLKSDVEVADPEQVLKCDTE